MGQDYGKRKGMTHLGVFDVDVKIPLTDEEKISLSKAHCEALDDVELMAIKKKEYCKQIKEQTKTKNGEALEISKMIRSGHRVERMTLPCFLDLETHERVYVDVENEKEMAREPMRENDRQMTL